MLYCTNEKYPKLRFVRIDVSSSFIEEGRYGFSNLVMTLDEEVPAFRCVGRGSSYRRSMHMHMRMHTYTYIQTYTHINTYMLCFLYDRSKMEKQSRCTT